MENFPERLKLLREEKKLSMAQLSSKINVSDAAICKWEKGISEPIASNLFNLSEVFEVSTDYLLGLENDDGIKRYSTPQLAIQEITLEESQLLNNYRTLPKDLKHRVDRYVADIARIFHDEVETKSIKKLY